MFQIVIVVDGQGNMGIQAPPNMNPLQVASFLDLAHAMTLNEIINPKKPGIVPVDANALDRLNGGH